MLFSYYLDIIDRSAVWTKIAWKILSFSQKNKTETINIGSMTFICNNLNIFCLCEPSLTFACTNTRNAGYNFSHRKSTLNWSIFRHSLSLTQSVPFCFIVGIKTKAFDDVSMIDILHLHWINRKNQCTNLKGRRQSISIDLLERQNT